MQIKYKCVFKPVKKKAMPGIALYENKIRLGFWATHNSIHFYE